MLTFLTLDVNNDGFICEKDLFLITKRIAPFSKIFGDIFQIMDYMEDRINDPDRKD
jgi:hypothetical protein